MGKMNGKTPTPPPDDTAEGEPAPAPPDSNEMDGSTEGAGEHQPNVTPQEQKQYSDFVNNGMLLIYQDDKAFATIRQKLREGAKTDPVGTLAGLALMIVQRLEQSSPQKLDPAVLLQGGLELAEQIADIAKRDGSHDYSEKELEGAVYQAVDRYRLAKKQMGQIDVGAAQRDLQQLKQDDASGALEKQVPGLKEHVAKQQQQSGADQGNQPPPPPDQTAGAGVRGFGGP